MLCAGLLLATSAAAQQAPALSIRPFALGTTQSFAAKETFDAAFETSVAPFFGGGVQVVLWDRFIAEVGASRFRMTGERAFRSGNTNFRLGIPLTATITPVEITGGYRFLSGRMRRIRPYVAAGWGRYAYKETSDFADPGDDVDTSHSGWIANGGAEFRIQRSIAIGADVQYSRVPGILGAGGVSQQAGENDLGGLAGRLKVIIGR
jgi:outer membrane protein W